MNDRIISELVVAGLTVASTLTAMPSPKSATPEQPARPFAFSLAAQQPSAAEERKATEFVQKQIDEHWIKTADGWTTKFQRKNAVGEVIPGEPVLLYRQLRDIDFTLDPQIVSEDDERAGVSYRADVRFDKTSERFYRRTQSDEGPKGWSAWQDAGVSSLITVERRHGRWVLHAEDLLDGVRPNASAVPAD